MSILKFLSEQIKKKLINMREERREKRENRRTLKTSMMNINGKLHFREEC